MLLERSIAVTKMVLIVGLVIVAILSLCFTNAYGLPTAINLHKPGEGRFQNGSIGNPPDVQSGNWGTYTTFITDDYGLPPSDKEMPPSAAPEPTTLLLLGVGLAGVRYLKRKG
jgi:hypothetical protein